MIGIVMIGIMTVSSACSDMAFGPRFKGQMLVYIKL